MTTTNIERFASLNFTSGLTIPKGLGLTIFARTILTRPILPRQDERRRVAGLRPYCPRCCLRCPGVNLFRIPDQRLLGGICGSAETARTHKL